MNLTIQRFAVLLLLGLACSPTARAQEPATTEPITPDGVVRELYDIVTFDAGTTPDWDAARALFIDEAVIVLRTSRTGNTVFGDIANVWVLYEASIPGDGRPPQQGVDNFSLVRRDGRWLIAAITNEAPAVAGPVPEALGD